MTVPPPPAQRPTPPPPGPPDTTKAVLAHAGGLVLGFLAPLIVFLISDFDPYSKEHAKEALNFHISFMLWSVASTIAIVVLVGFFLLIGLMVVYVVFQIMGAVAASRWQSFRYPLTIRFIQ